MADRKLPQLDKRFYDVVFGEAGGGSPEEIRAVASVFLNRAEREGYERALRGSAAYTTESPQYRKAFLGDLNAYEKLIYERNRRIVDDLVENPDTLLPFTHFENVEAFGEPSWAPSMESFEDIGRQRFYVERKPRVKALESSEAKTVGAMSTANLGD